MSSNYGHQKTKKLRADTGKAWNDLVKIPQQKLSQGVNPNNGKKRAKL